METEIDRINRRTWPGLWPRFAIWVGVTYAINYTHARIRPAILARLRYEWLVDIYVRVTTIGIITFTLVGLGALVACYYYSLRNRRTYSALTEVGLAMRSIVASLLAIVGFGLALHINEGGFQK
jgi:hypothetical protein